MKKIRLHQYLSKTAQFKSKQSILDAVRNGEIKIESKVINNSGFQFHSSKTVFYKGKKLSLITDKTYLILNKPAGYLSSKLTSADEKLGKKSVFSLLRGIDTNIIKTLFCVGRLDEDTSGLLIITNDGNLSHKIINPKFKIEKEYLAELEKEVSAKDKEKLEHGVKIQLEENGKISPHQTLPCKIKIINPKKVKIILQEGKKREVRRMLEAVENKVLNLERIALGKLNLNGIKESEFKIVSKEYILENI